MLRRQFIVLSGAGMAAASFAQPRSLRIVVPFAAAGSSDIATRAIAEPLGRALGLTVQVDNRPGGGGSVGMAEVAKAPADGSVIGVATVSTHGVNPVVYKKLPYDPVADFAPIAEFVKAPTVLVVHPSVPADTIEGFIKYVKSNPGKLVFSSPGVGSIGHMLGEMFKSTTGTFMVHVPASGSTQASAEVAAGRAQLCFDQVASTMPLIREGKLKALAVSWPTRLESLPQVPTYAEATLFANNFPTWFGFVAPAGVPPAEIQRLSQGVRTALGDAAVRARLKDIGLYPTGSTSDEFGQQIKKEIDRMQRIARYAKISLG